MLLVCYFMVIATVLHCYPFEKQPPCIKHFNGKIIFCHIHTKNISKQVIPDHAHIACQIKTFNTGHGSILKHNTRFLKKIKIRSKMIDVYSFCRVMCGYVWK